MATNPLLRSSKRYLNLARRSHAEQSKQPLLSDEDRDQISSQNPSKRRRIGADYAMEGSKGKEGTHGRQAQSSDSPHRAQAITEEELDTLHAATSMSDFAKFVAHNSDLRCRPGKEKAYAIMLAKITAWHNWKVTQDVLEDVLYGHRYRPDDLAFRREFTSELMLAEMMKRCQAGKLFVRKPEKRAAHSSDEINMPDDTGAEGAVETAEDRYVHPVSRPPFDEISSSIKLKAIGCRTCSRRRILCDRALPACRKCIAKGIECPGYGVQLRWTNAVHLRGPFKGLTASEVVNANVSSPGCGGRLNSRSAPQEAGTGPNCDPDSAILPLSDPVVDRFFQHYASDITPMMVWLDSDNNEYRRLVLPLAKNHLILRLAVCAISAEHVPQEPDFGLQFSSDACEGAIAKITDQIRSLTSHGNDIAVAVDYNDRSVEGTLAAMLILANRSLFASDPSPARSHRRAARILLDTLSMKRSPTDELFVFLKNQVSLCQILLCTTLFNAEDIESAITPDHGRGDVILGHFLNLVHRITRRPDDFRREDPFLDDIESKFELALGSSLLVGGRLMGTRPRSMSFQEDYIRWIQVFRHAGILYACKRLQIVSGAMEEYHVSRLLKALGQFHDIHAVMHNLAWPLFIAGICVCRSPERRAIILDLGRIMSTKTPFRHYARILTFLEELWETSHQDWVILAKEWEDRGEPVLAV